MPNIVLAMFKSDGTRRDFPVVKDRVIIGRKVNCDLRIPLTSVSRQHCELTVDGNKVQVKDLGSSNGTYHNSERVQEAYLAAGDELVIGPVVFTLVVDGEPSDIKPVRTIVGGAASEGSGHAPTVTQPQQTQPNGAAAATVEAEDLDLSDMFEADDAIPTVDLDDDDDPIAALESLANDDDDASSADFDDIDFFEIDDDDDDK
ncbi:MAG: FHA domain-containing protein [Phycisphaeraceae bacterium]